MMFLYYLINLEKVLVLLYVVPIYNRDTIIKTNINT